jgi:hypothetical protein
VRDEALQPAARGDVGGSARRVRAVTSSAARP